MEDLLLRACCSSPGSCRHGAFVFLCIFAIALCHATHIRGLLYRFCVTFVTALQARVNPKTQAPIVATLITGAVIGVLAFFVPLEVLVRVAQQKRCLWCWGCQWARSRHADNANQTTRTCEHADQPFTHARLLLLLCGVCLHPLLPPSDMSHTPINYRQI